MVSRHLYKNLDQRAAGVGKLHRMAESTADVLGLDWSTDMAQARSVLGNDRVLQGNVDPAVLFASEVRYWRISLMSTPASASQLARRCNAQLHPRSFLSLCLFTTK